MKISKENYYKLYQDNEKPASTLYHKYISKKLAKFFTYYFLKFRITPNQLSIQTTILSVAGVICLNFFESPLGPLLFMILLQISYVLDCSDGVVARITNTSSPFGAYLDITLDRLNIFIVYTGLGLYLHAYSPFNEISLIIFVLSAIFYFQYQLMALLRKQYFKSLDGFMKSDESIGGLKSIIKFIYEFIDTGIFFFILAIGTIFNLVFETVIIYGVLGLCLSISLYAFLSQR